MRYKSIFYLSVSLVFFLAFKVLLEREFFFINVQGRAEILLANQFKDGLTNFLSKPLERAKILAVNGRIKSTNGNVLIPIKILSKKTITSYTNIDGRFTFRLRPGIYTFFIVNKDNAYLNSFDGKGYFKSYKVFSRNDNILITVTSNSYF